MSKTKLIVALIGAASFGCTGRSGDAVSVTGMHDSGGGVQDSGGGLVFNSNTQLIHECDASRPSKEASAEDSGGRADASGCTASQSVQFARDVKPLFSRCSGEVCHSDTWGSGDPYPFLVGVKATECCDARLRVAPHDPQGSYVVQKLEGRSLCRGSQMPLGDHLDPAQIQTIADWICLGAPND